MSETRFRYSNHARKRMRERNISRRQVESVVKRPDRQYPDPEDAALTIAERLTDMGNTLRVVYAETSSGLELRTVVVVTVIRAKGDRTRES